MGMASERASWGSKDTGKAAAADLVGGELRGLGML